MRGHGGKGAGGGIRTANGAGNDDAGNRVASNSGTVNGGASNSGTGVAAVAVLGALLCASLTACTGPTTAASPVGNAGIGTATVSHGASAPAHSGSPHGHPASTTDPGSAGRSPTPSLTTAVITPGASPSAPAPSASGSARPPGSATPRTGPADDGGEDDGGEDARVFCSPTALSFVFRIADEPRGGRGSRPPGADVRAPGDAVLVARNTSGHTCVLRGFPTLTVTDDTGRPLITATRTKPFTKPFALHPGAGGVARVHYTAHRGCPGTAVRVSVPGSGTANSVPVLDARGRPALLSVCGPALHIGEFTPGFG
ncbi:DUF4232 domain-containing protein [Streptomyces sp. NPDC048361]|uniref:DUF4232 domain-containing protein n=1 Tax=Streptomyces sp. NPDC048361 TaxID=3154720 RepID=UPI0034339D7A